MTRNGVVAGPLWDWFVPMIVNQDGAEHRRLRGLVHKAFTPRTVNDIRPFIRATAERLVDELAARESCEFIEDFGDRLPLAVMCELLGVPPADYDTFRAYTTDMGLVFSLAHGADIRERVETAVAGLYGYIDALMAEKKAKPGADLISELIAVQQAEGQVSWVELLNLVVTLVFAAHDNTRQQLTNAMAAFARHPDQWRLLGRQPELAAQAVDEAIRWWPAAGALYRFATEEFEYEGLPVAAGDFLMVSVLAAQRDPRAFENPQAFDITIARRGPLQFGAGPHHCLGAALALAEMSEALTIMTARLGPPVVAGPVPLHPPTGIYGPSALPLRFG